MAWIVKVAASTRHPQTRWQVRYRQGTTQRSAGIYLSKPEAVQVKRALERGDHIASSDGSCDQRPAEAAAMLFGDYIAEIWWPAWKPDHPRSAEGTKSKLNHRILPALGKLPLGHLNPTVIAGWRRAMTHEGLSPTTVSTYLSLLGTICNSAVADGHLAHSPLATPATARTTRRRRHPALAQIQVGLSQSRAAARLVWLSRPQLDQLADAIDPFYRTLVLVAALTGVRWGELTAIRWEDVRPDLPLDDGAVAGPGRLRILPRPPSPSPSTDLGDQDQDTSRQPQQRSAPRGDRRLIALDLETVELLQQHRCLAEGRNRELVFTVPIGNHSAGRPLAATSFARSWLHALRAAGLDQLFPGNGRGRGGLRFHDLRHTHAVWLLAREAPIAAIGKRLGHTTPITTMRMYQHPAQLIHDGTITSKQLGLPQAPA